MAYEIKYKGNFTSLLGNRFVIDILEDDFAGDIIPIKIVTASLNYPDGDRDIYTPIRSSNLAFQVLCNIDLPASSFLTETQYQYKVNLYRDEVLAWCGWLDSKELKMPLKDVNHAVDLVAKDGLNILGASDLIKLDGDPFTSVHTVIEYLAAALKPTNLDLDIAAYCDFYPIGLDDSSNESTFDFALVHYSTFAVSGSKYETCYETLEKIMHSFKCTLFQLEGRWIIFHWEQMYDTSGNLFGKLYDSLGAYDSALSGGPNMINVGLNQLHKFINNDALITWSEAATKITTNFRYDPPVSPIFNSTWEYSTLVPPVLEPYADGWQDITSPPATDPQVQFVYDGDTLTRKSLQINENTATRSPEFLVHEGDLFSINCEVGNRLIISVVLENGVNTYYLKPDGKWQSTPITCADVIEDTFNIETVDKAPFSGRVHLDLVWGARLVTFPSFVRNLVVQITPIFNNESTTNGYYVTRYNPNINPVEFTDEIYISSSPNHAVKGALLKHNTTGSNDYYEPQQFWYRNGADEETAFVDMMSRAYYKMNYRRRLRMEAALFRVVSDGALLSPFSLFVHEYYLTKIFSLGSISINLAKDTAEITAIELLDSTIDTEDDTDVKLQGFINRQDVEFETPIETKKPLSWRWGPTGVIIQLITKKRWGKIR
jgi:hypothetical protein